MMSWINSLPVVRRMLAPARRTRKVIKESGAAEFLEHNRFVSVAIFIFTVAAILMVSWTGNEPVSMPLLANQTATLPVTAHISFSYESRLRTDAAYRQLRERVPPAYTLDQGPYAHFEANLIETTAAIEAWLTVHPDEGPAARLAALVPIVDGFNQRGPCNVAVEDFATFAAIPDPQVRHSLVANGLATLRDIYRAGVCSDTDPLLGQSAGDRMVMVNIIRPDGRIQPSGVQTFQAALSFLHVNLQAESGIAPETFTAVWRIFRAGLIPNLVFDEAATDYLRAEASAGFRPVTVQVRQGEVIVEAGQRVTPEQYEKLVAMREQLIASANAGLAADALLVGRVLLVLAMVIASVFYIRLEDRATLESNGRLALLSIVVLINLALIRLTFLLGHLGHFLTDTSSAAALPYLAPVALAPIILTVLIGRGPAIFTALFIGIFAAVMQGNRLDFLVMAFLSSIFGIFVCRRARKRSRLVWAGIVSGLSLGIFAVLLGLADHIPSIVITKQVGGALAVGLLTGIAVSGLLPLLEILFKRTTDITLLELTDFNHPLLRQMQFEAPGTYHHSLMVASLAENAAAAINANALLCRVCALFHDIGKTVKPEYFTENQRDCPNPHDERTPSISALIIKSHIKEGVSLAIKHKLPRVVIDVIKQHHGTSLIQYFYHRARNRSAHGIQNPALLPLPEPDTVCETTYRYDGPRPQFKESAIIHLADPIEAASRSLRKVTPQHINEVIDQIIAERLADGQLEECPITLEELTQVKMSFRLTLLNALHGRIPYPESRPPFPQTLPPIQGAPTRPSIPPADPSTWPPPPASPPTA